SGNAEISNAQAALNLGTITTTAGGGLIIETDSGGITDSGVITASGTSSVTTTAAGDDITLDQVSTYADAVSLNTNAAANSDASLTNANLDINLGTSNVGGNLTIETDNNDITNSGALIIGGNSTFTVNDAGGASITVANAGNNFTGPVAFGGAALANVTVLDTTVLDLQAINQTGNLVVTALGIMDSGVLDVGGITSLTAGSGNNILLDSANDFTGAVSVVSGNNVTLTDANAIDLGASTVSGNLVVTATGNITDSGDLAITGTTTIANAGNSVVLDRVGNDFGGAVAVTGTGVTLVDVNSIDLGDSTVTGTYAVTAVGINVTGVVGAAVANLTAGNAINGGGGTLDAGTVDLNAVTGIGNTTALNTASSTIDADSTDGNIDLNNEVAGAVTINSLTTGTGSITLDQTGNTAVELVSVAATSGNVNVAGAGTLTATNVQATGTLGISSGGDMIIDTVGTGGAVTLTAGGTINGVNTRTFSGNSVAINAATVGLDTRPIADVTAVTMTLTGEVSGQSGLMDKTATLASRPPDGNISSPGTVQIGPWDYLATEVDISAILASLATLSSAQQQLETLLDSTTASEFFMTPPLEIYIDMEEESEFEESLEDDF
ncbi:MAG: hypothetical protein GY697_02240, partial [Desulfobacterales bacterium]|nr:hypothetical protein [Desulfobacterales bacterium]